MGEVVQIGLEAISWVVFDYADAEKAYNQGNKIVNLFPAKI